ncbi:MAG: sulfate adenylyltransferase [Bacteroidetes bacterium]|nr:sulfate adenylyltransferase [Bacteroidota bacterium]
MELIKIATAGSVDDGKSTLIGRLLYETGALKTDQIQHIEEKSAARGFGYLDLSLATDGLLTEREQGITIDVSHIFFSTPKRRFIIADSPGHVEYTRNMVTGTSTAQASIILLDARKGVIEQTKRHFFITQLLGIKQIIFAVNKMDLVDYSQDVFENIKTTLESLVDKHGQEGVTYHYTPVSALYNENVVSTSEKLNWHKGEPLLSLIETIPLESNQANDGAFQIQYVIRPKREELHDYRGFAGNVRSGSFAVGDAINIHPSGRKSIIKRIEKYGESTGRISAGENGTILLVDEIDASRGDSILNEKANVNSGKNLSATFCWMQDTPLTPGNKYWLQQGIQRSLVKVQHVRSKIDLEALENRQANQLELNDIGKGGLALAQPITTKSYKDNPALGAFILIDPNTFNTAGVGFIETT